MITKKIMVVIENQQPCDAAINYAIELASSLSADVHILGIMSPNDALGSSEFVDPVLWSVAKSEFEAVVNSYAEQVRSQHINTETKITKAPQIEELCCQKSGLDCQIIVLQIDGENLSPRVQTVLKHATVPVFLARASAPTAQQGFKNVLVPLDGSQRAESCLNLASAIVRASSGNLHLVNVIQPTERPTHSTFSNDDRAMEQQLIDRSVFEAKRYLNQVASYLGMDTINHTLVENKVTHSLHQLIDQGQIDLLVMCAHGHSGEAKWTSGTIADNLIRYANIPTIVVQDLPSEIQRSPLEAIRVTNGVK